MIARSKSGNKTITEEIEVAGGELIARIRALLAEGQVRHIKVRGPGGEVYFEMPLSFGVLGGAALTWAAPWLAMAGALAALVSRVKIEVVRDAAGTEAIEDGAKPTARRGRVGSKAKASAPATRRAAADAKRGASRTTAGAAPAKRAKPTGRKRAKSKKSR